MVIRQGIGKGSGRQWLALCGDWHGMVKGLAFGVAVGRFWHGQHTCRGLRWHDGSVGGDNDVAVLKMAVWQWQWQVWDNKEMTH